MKHLLPLLIIFCSISTIQAQDWEFEKPDYKKIEKNIKKKSSPLFYNDLMDRFIAGDTTMTLKEKRHLYYGFTFQDNYSPYARSDYFDSIRAVFQNEELALKDFKNIIKFGDSVLAKNPFELRVLNYQLYALEQTEQIETFNIKVFQLNAVFDALLSSGDGKSKETSFYAINTSHEYDVLNALGFKYGGQQSLIEHYDYLTVEENSANIEGLYFDISPSLNSLSKMLDD